VCGTAWNRGAFAHVAQGMAYRYPRLEVVESKYPVPPFKVSTRARFRFGKRFFPLARHIARPTQLLASAGSCAEIKTSSSGRRT
jgi:hypothetical protein